MSTPLDTPPPVHVINHTARSATRHHYQLSSPVAQTAAGVDFFTDHVIVSWGSAGDTCIFPAGPEGNILDLIALWMDDSYVDHNDAVRQWLEGKA